MSTVAEEKKRNGRREPEVRAKICPKCASPRTRVYRSMLIIRYCVCKECGGTWRQAPSY
jgi:hypothetical protein